MPDWPQVLSIAPKPARHSPRCAIHCPLRESFRAHLSLPQGASWLKRLSDAFSLLVRLVGNKGMSPIFGDSIWIQPPVRRTSQFW